MIAVDIQLARLRQPTKEAMSLRGRKNLPADSSISSSAEAPVIRGEAAARSILKKNSATLSGQVRRSLLR
jgi:hypothetical protein